MMFVIPLFSLFTQSATPFKRVVQGGNIACEISERREQRLGGLLKEQRVTSLLSLFTQFASRRSKGQHSVRVSAPISNSQPTRCGHTLTRCPLPGLASGFAPSTPSKAERQGKP